MTLVLVWYVVFILLIERYIRLLGKDRVIKWSSLHAHNKAKIRILQRTNQIYRSREESEVWGFFVFLHIRMMGYFRSGYLRVIDQG